MSVEQSITKSPDSKIHIVVGSRFFSVDIIRLNASNSAPDLNGFEDIFSRVSTFKTRIIINLQGALFEVDCLS